MSDPKRRSLAEVPGITVISCTKRPQFMEHMFRNYRRQIWRNKEWVIVINKDQVDIEKYRNIARRLGNIRIFHQPARCSLGHCLNFAAARANHRYIAKMDDDEYYAPFYLHGMMRAFQRSKADVVGKRAFFIYLNGKRLLIQRFKQQNRYVSMLAGATLVFKRSVWQKVKFANRSLGEDIQFCSDCRRKGFKLYSGDRYNFCALRRKRPNSHTWKASDRELIAHPQTKIIAHCQDYKRYIERHR